MNKALFKSERSDWQTPDVVLDAVREFEPIVLDPCTTIDNPVNAFAWYTEIDNGLMLPWHSNSWPDGCVYINPPYGRKIGRWIERSSVDAGIWPRNRIALVPARTDTRWWQRSTHDAVCFWRGRLTFRRAPHPAPFPSAVLLWSFPYGSDAVMHRFEDVFNKHGEVWTR